MKDLGLNYNALQLLSRGLSIDNIRLNKPVVYLRREGDGWSLGRLIKKQEEEADRKGPEKPITIDDIGISGGAVVFVGPSGAAIGTSGSDSPALVMPKRFDQLDAKLSFKYEPVHYSIAITHLSFRGSEPTLALNALSGAVAVKDDTVFLDEIAIRTAETSLAVDGAIQNYLARPLFNLHVSSDKLAIGEIARLVPSLSGISLQPKLEIKVDGPVDHLGVEMNVQSSAGEAWTKLVADVEAPGQSVVGDVSVKHLDLAPLVNDPKQRSDISGDAKVDLRGASLSDLSSLRGTATVRAKRIKAAGYDVGPLDARTRINGKRIDLNARAGAYGAKATAAGHVVLRDEPAFDVRGHMSNVDLRKLPRQLNVPPASTDVNGEYRVAGTASNLTADLRFEPSIVADAAIEEGSTASVTLTGTDVGIVASAGIHDLNLQRAGEAFAIASLASDRYKSRINGRVTADVRGIDTAHFDADALEATVKATVDRSTVGDLAIDKASVDADYHQSVGEIRTLEIASLDLNVTAAGTLALNDDGESDLKVHADSSKLETLGGLFDAPVTGIGKLDATVTGNRRALQAKGNLIANGFKYEKNGALTASTDFTATVPDLDVERANVSAKT